jgi:hypothetical protein
LNNIIQHNLCSFTSINTCTKCITWKCLVIHLMTTLVGFTLLRGHFWHSPWLTVLPERKRTWREHCQNKVSNDRQLHLIISNSDKMFHGSLQFNHMVVGFTTTYAIDAYHHSIRVRCTTLCYQVCQCFFHQ